MSKDHYLPASFIARFGALDKGSERKRDVKVWIARSDNLRAVQERAASFGYANNLYGASGECPGTNMTIPSFDSWRYETELNAILDNVSDQRPVMLSDWLHVLVPFVAGLFSRGLDFNQRYEVLYDQLSLEAAADETWRNANTNISRHIRMERLLSAVMSSDWIVHHVPFPHSAISNNFGLATMYDPQFRKNGWVIPIDPGCILSILPGRSKFFGEYYKDVWWAILPHTHYPLSFFKYLNKSIADQSSSFIFGNNREVVSLFSANVSSKSVKELFAIMDSDWGPEIEGALYPHRFDWYIATAIADSNASPAELSKRFPGFGEIDQRRWNPFLFEIPSERDLRPHGIAYDDDDGLLRISLEKTDKGLLAQELGYFEGK